MTGDASSPAFAPSTSAYGGRWLARKRRTSLVLGAVLAVSTGAAVAVAMRPAGTRTTTVAAPGFSLVDARNPAATVALADRGGHPAVVTFLASWCDPCRAELPTFAKVAATGADGVRFFGVDTKDSDTQGPELLVASGVGFPVGADPEGTVAGRYHVEGMPTTVFVAADGHIVQTVTGPLDGATLARHLARITPR